MIRAFTIYVLVALAGILAVGCKTTAVAVISSKDYKEDLSAYRQLPSIPAIDAYEIDTVTASPANNPVAVTNAINGLLTNYSDSLATLNRRNGFIQGYTIQVYSGSSREAANKAKQKVYMASPDAEPAVKWVSPNYKVKVGLFTEHLKAQKLFITLKEEFPNAILIPERIGFNN